MKRMDDKDFFGAAAGGSFFRANGPDARDDVMSPANAADTGTDHRIGASPSVASSRVSAALGRVGDLELRAIMKDILEEDADLIAYLRDR